MATFVLKNAKLYMAQYDMSGHHNRISLTHDQAVLDDTAFGDSFRSRISGLQDVRLDAAGWFQAGLTGEPDTVYAGQFAQGSTVFSVFPCGGSAGEVGYLGRLLHIEYELGGSVEDLVAFIVHGDGTILVPASVLHTGRVDETGDSTPLQLGAVGAGEHLYGAIHVLSASGTDPTLDVVIESDDAEAFSDPTTRITFTQATGATSEWATPVAGAVTDTWWRISYTVGGTDDPAFNFVVVLGIR